MMRDLMGRRVVVGAYQSRREAERALEHLHDQGIADAEVTEPVEDVVEVTVPLARREEALAELGRVEEWIIAGH